MENILFNKAKNGVLVCKNPRGQEIYFDIKNEPSIAILDGSKDRLKKTIEMFAESILAQEDFYIVTFDDDIKNILNKRVSVYYGKDYESVITKIAEEIDNRYKLFSKNKVKNIVEYNKTIGNLQRIALIIDCELTDFIKRKSTEKCFYEILSKGWAAGLFTCLFSTSELKSKICFSDILGLIPFSADYYEYEHAYAMLQNDEKFKQAIKFATIAHVVNATTLQKKLKIGCSRAEKYVETMQNLGIIGRDEFYTLRTES